MREKFAAFQEQVEAIKARVAAGEISEAERDESLRQMRLQDNWGDTWMLSPRGEWFRKARGSDTWIRDYPLELIDPDMLPPVAHMNIRQLARAVSICTRCPLHQTRTRGVPG